MTNISLRLHGRYLRFGILSHAAAPLRKPRGGFTLTQKVRERTLNDYKKYIDKFLEQGEAERMGKVAVPHKRWEATASQCVGTELQEIL